MKKYFTRYFIETPNSIGNRKDLENEKALGWKFNFGNNEISLYDHKLGLFTDCYIEAESELIAEERSKTFVENILNLIDFSTSSASNTPIFVLLYEATDDLSIRSFKQIFYTSLPERNIAPIDKDIFEKIFESFNKNQEARIARALSWLRKGYLERKFIDRFIAFWTGLEAINELLADFYKIPNEERKFHCPYCGKSLSYITAGVKKLFIDELKLSKEQFDEIRKDRGKLLHGGGPLDNNFVEEIKKYIPLVRKALIVGISRLLNLSDKYINQILKKKTKLYNERVRIILRANIKNLIFPKLDEFGKQPRFDLDKQGLLKRVIDEEGKINLKIASNFIAKNANFEIKSIELWSDDNTAIEKAQFTKVK